MKRLHIVISLVVGVLGSGLLTGSLLAEIKPNQPLEVIKVEFEPIGKGKNVVFIDVRNQSEDDQVLAVHIQTRSTRGWGTNFFDTVKGKQTKHARFAFQIYSETAPGSWIRLRFANPPTVEDYDYDLIFLEQKFKADQLPQRKPNDVTGKQAMDSTSNEIIDTFQKFQSFLEEEHYDQAFEILSRDHQCAGFHSRQPGNHEAFIKFMTDRRWGRYMWQKNQALKMKTESVIQYGDQYILKTANDEENWQVVFIREDDGWKIDWITGYTDMTDPRANWERLLSKLNKRETDHFDIYYYPDSTAEKEIDDIVAKKEKGYTEIDRFLGGKSTVRINLVFFEDAETKLIETGHQGMGMAHKNNIVEIYNEQQKLDPYHETVHVLMQPIGDPPAVFNEGFATYMSERLGGRGLQDLGGGESTLYERCRQLQQEGKWIELQELFTYQEIGSERSQPTVAYPQAGAFVKFLIDQYGKDKFIAAYDGLRNSGRESDIQNNHQHMEEIYGQSLQELNDQWLEAMKQ